MKEIWKPVKDFEKYYMISNKGNLKSIIKRQYSFKDKKIIEIKERNELRLEILENIFYGIEFGNVKNIEQVKSMINEDLLNRY